MAKVNGTAGNDTLIATRNNDEIFAFDGDDRIIGSLGNDTIDGGNGNDRIDYRGLNRDLDLSVNSTDISVGKSDIAALLFNRDRVTNVERVVGNSNRVNQVTTSSSFSSTDINNAEIDLANGRVTLDNSVTGQKTVAFDNFNNYRQIGSKSGERYRIVGNDRDNKIQIGSLGDVNQTIIGSKGNDMISDSNRFATQGQRTIDYSNLSESIVLTPRVRFEFPRGDFQAIGFGSVSKGSLGTDNYQSMNRFVAPVDRNSTIDGSRASFLKVDLSKNVISAIDPQLGGTIAVENFVNVIGSGNSDTIIGGNSGGNLNGGASGSDIVTGGTGDDIIAGTSGQTGLFEVDTLTGGGGVNTFVLGGNSGAYYLGGEEKDYALITNFDLFNDTIDIGNTASYDLDPISASEVNLFTANNAGVRDLVAKIQLNEASQVSFGAARSARVADGVASDAIDPLVPPIKILSTGGSNAPIESV